MKELMEMYEISVWIVLGITLGFMFIMIREEYFKYKKERERIIKSDTEYLKSRWKHAKEMYHKDGKLHSINGPSLIIPNGKGEIHHYYVLGVKEKTEYLNEAGELHKEDGPALIEYNEDGGVRHKGYFYNDIDVGSMGNLFIIVQNEKLKELLKNRP